MTCERHGGRAGSVLCRHCDIEIASREELQKELVAILALEDKFFNLRRISGLICGLQDYITTRAIVVGLTAKPAPGSRSYLRRYCYQDRDEADLAFFLWSNADEHPPGNWIKLKGAWGSEQVDLFNPDWVNRDK